MPPPLPVADEAVVRPAGTSVMARLAPPHAPMIWRTLAFLMDALVFGLLGYLLLTRVLLPEFKTEALSGAQHWVDGFVSLYGDLWRQAEAGNQVGVDAINATLLERLQNAPDAVYEISAYSSSAMTLIYWAGFSLAEILTGGASLGKRVFRLRVATFPHAQRPGVFDSLVRNGWKALAVATLNPLALLFAIVDAHWPLFNPLRRSLHDLLSRTVVLDARYDPPEEKATRVAMPDDDE